MKQEPYADRNVLFYPARNLSEREKQRMESYDISIEELTTDHIVYSMSRQIETNFQTFYTVAEDVVGEERALEIAREIGRRYGGGGYAKLLQAHGTPGVGSPRHMALYQDLVHAIRGPKHTAALYATHDAERCVVKRDACIYYDERFPQNGKYTGAFEDGCLEGYRRADVNMDRTEVRQCRWRGEAGCEIHWVFKKAQERTPAAT